MWVVTYEGQEGTEVEIFSKKEYADKAYDELMKAEEKEREEDVHYRSVFSVFLCEVEVDKHIMEDGTEIRFVEEIKEGD